MPRLVSNTPNASVRRLNARFEQDERQTSATYQDTIYSGIPMTEPTIFS